jgi:hypothetical protein
MNGLLPTRLKKLFCTSYSGSRGLTSAIHNTQIRKDQRLVISSGRCADYKVIAYARALRDFNAIEQIQRFKKHLNSENDVPYAQQKMFLFWATKIQLLEFAEEAPGVEWWLGIDGELCDR